MPLPAQTEAACISREDVLVLLRNDELAVLVLEFHLPTLELLKDTRGQANLIVPVLDLGENGLLKMEKRPDVKWG